jgi:hypothetical protein
MLRNRTGKVSTVVSTEREMRVTDSNHLENSSDQSEHDTLVDEIFQP